MIISSGLILWLLTACFFQTSQSASVNSQLRRCRMSTGHPGLCVVGRFCRVRLARLTPCPTEDMLLYCCPFPTNGTLDWSLEERDSEPIVYPGDSSGPSKDTPGQNNPDSDEIVFPGEQTINTGKQFAPHNTAGFGFVPMPRPTESASSTSRIPLKHSIHHDTIPKTLNTALERNTNESKYGSEEFDVEDQIAFEIIPRPKTTTTTEVPKQRNDLIPIPFSNSISTSKTDMSPSSTSAWNPRWSKEFTDFSTSTSSSIGKSTPVNIDTTSKPLETACGTAPYSLFIAGGNESGPNQWPWMAAIYQRFTTARPNKFLCGGSLISTRYILTAAHCCVSGISSVALPASSFLVRMGSSDVHEGDNYSITKVKVHSNFSFEGQFNDIALLRLTADISYTNRIAAVCLPYPNLLEADLVDQQATVVGWGATYLGGQPQKKLHEVSIPIVSTDDCALAYSRIKSAAFLARGSTHVLCAGLKEGGKDSCKSDSGGPLMIPLENNRWTIIGIVSFGYRCAEPGFPGVYTRVTHYLEWLYSNTQD